MQLQVCPHCGTMVVFSAAGICPACRHTRVDVEAVAEGEAAASPAGGAPNQFRDASEMEERRVQVAKLPEPPSMTDVLLNPYESPRIPNHDDDAYDNRPVGRPEHEGLLWLLFSFEGRIPRRVYWGMSILVGVVSGSIELGILLVAGEKLELFVPLATTALAVVRTWIGLAIMAKRWHDRNKSGWMTLILFIPCVGALWMFIELGCLRGTRGENDFGADPT